MKRIILSASVLAVLVLAATTACNTPAGEKTETEKTAMTKEELVKRGEYLVNTIGCDDCHSPKVMGPQGPELDMEHRFAGHLAGSPLPPLDSAKMLNKGWALFSMDLTVAIGPWGTTYAANISSDSTGIGMWKEEQFIKAMREGKTKGLDNSRPIMPPMPWRNFAKLSDEDLKAMYHYLLSTKPVKNVVPAFQPGTPPPPPAAPKG